MVASKPPHKAGLNPRLISVSLGKSMEKNLKYFIVLTIVLSNALSFSSYAHAGYFDRLGSKRTSSTLVQGLSENRISESTDFWDIVNKTISDGQKKPLEFRVVKTYNVLATEYTSTPEQTDDTPFITADGTYVHDGIIAANFYVNGKKVPFKTLVRIPDIFGDKIFEVRDRMNSRYTNNIDIWVADINVARQFGAKRVDIEVIELIEES